MLMNYLILSYLIDRVKVNPTIGLFCTNFEYMTVLYVTKITFGGAYSYELRGARVLEQPDRDIRKGLSGFTLEGWAASSPMGFG